MRTTQERLRLTLRSNVCSAASTLLPLCSAIEPTTLTLTEKKHLIATQTGSSFVVLRKVFLNFFMYVYIIGGGGTGCV